MMNDKLNVKDLINVGIFTAIYFVVYFATGMIGYIPVLMLALPFLTPITGGIPFMLFMTRVKKFGMISITGIMVALLMFATGHGWPVLITGIIFPILADLIFKSGGYASWTKTLISYCVFSLWILGAMLPMWIMRDSYFATLRDGYGDEYADVLMNIMSGEALAVLPLLAIAGALVGAFIGRGTLKKHFKRAGIV
jgi:energy-coupling factor transport system substrate-specific component